METAHVTALVAVLSLVVAFATWLANTKRSSGQQDAHNASVVTKLDLIADDIKDIKADYRSISRKVDEVKDVAIRAEDSAKAAHRRLDRMAEEGHQH